MKACRILFAVAVAACAAQVPQAREEKEPHLKQSQVEAMLKQDQENSLKDAAQLIKLSEELKSELEKTHRNVLSLAALKKTEEIEKLARRIRGRMRRH